MVLNNVQSKLIMMFLLVINLIVFLLIRQGKISPEELGTSYAYVVQGKQYYRLLTSMFTHAQGWHLLCNTVSIINLMPFLTRQTGVLPSLAIYLTTGLVGGYIACRMNKNNPYTISIGASGAICGIYGFIVIYLIRYDWWRTNLKFILLNLIILIGMTKIPQIDSKSHFCSMAVGLVLGIVCWVAAIF